MRVIGLPAEKPKKEEQKPVEVEVPKAEEKPAKAAPKGKK
jgi:hypothetical protein